MEIFDTAIAIMAGLMIIPAVFAFSGGDPDTLQAGPALMFITIPKVFDSMGMGTVVGVLFFLLVLFAARDQLHRADRERRVHLRGRAGLEAGTSPPLLIGVIMVALGSLSAPGLRPAGRGHGARACSFWTSSTS